MPVFRRNAVRMWALLLALSLLGGCTSPAVEETPSPTPESPVPTATASVEESVAPLTREEAWLKDIEAFSEGYKTNHIDLFYWRDEAFFDQQVEELKTQVGDLTDDEIVVSLARIINSMQDGHSRVSSFLTPTDRTFPLQVQLLEDDKVYVINTAEGNFPDYSDCFYAEITAINGMPMEEVLELVLPVIFGERYANAQRAWFPEYFYPRLLTVAGVPDRDGTFTFTFRNEAGESYEKIIETIPSDAEYQWSVEYPMLFTTNTGFNWYEFWEDEALLYFTYNTCSDLDNTLRSVLGDILTLLREGRVETLVVDLRNNGGGNSSLLSNFCERLASNSVYSYQNLYVVIGGNTFSSGALNAMQFAEETPAVLIGTPTGENPDDLGDVAVFSLPNSGLYCQFSTAIFKSGIRYSSTDALPHLDFERSSLEPDIYIANDIDAWKGQYDNVLNYILEHT